MWIDIRSDPYSASKEWYHWYILVDNQTYSCVSTCSFCCLFIGFSFGSSGTTAAVAPGSIRGVPFGTTPASTLGLNLGTQPGSTGGLNLGAKPATQAGGFSFGSTTPSSGFQFGKPATTTTSNLQTGGFTFGSVTSSGVSFGAPATPSYQAASIGLKLGSTGKLSTSYSC